MTAGDKFTDELDRLVQEHTEPPDTRSINEAVQLFLKNIESELSPTTIDEYEAELIRFREYCQRNGVEDTAKLKNRVIVEFKIWRRDEGHSKDGSLSSKTMRDEMYLLQKFTRFLASVDAVKPNLHRQIQIPSLDPGDGTRDIDFSADRLKTILDHLEKYEYATREHAVWVLFAATGRRPSDLRALDCGDVHLDKANPYIEFQHREGETRLKNGKKSENTVSISKTVAETLSEYIEVQRADVPEGTREPLLTSTEGRLSTGTIRKYVYKWSRPCVIGQECPHDRDDSSCEALESTDKASKCPSSEPPLALRHGYISNLRRERVPLPVISDRCDASEDVIEKHYEEVDEDEKRELRRQELERVSDDGGYL